MDLVIDGKWLYYPHSGKLITDGRIIVEGDRIVYSGQRKRVESAKQSGHEHYNYDKGLIIPGLVNAHTHIPMTLQRGISENKPLQTWLEYIWSIEPHLLPKDAYWGSMLGIAEMFARQVHKKPSQSHDEGLSQPGPQALEHLYSQELLSNRFDHCYQSLNHCQEQVVIDQFGNREQRLSNYAGYRK